MPGCKMTTRQKISLVIIGLFAGIVLLEIGLRTAGGIFLYCQERANIASLEGKGDYVILCLGESTTFNMYPRQLERVLNERIDDLKISVIDKGVPGIHTTHILSRLEGYLDAYRPDLVIAMMGVNDRENTKVFVRPPEDDRPASEIRTREENPGNSLANLRVYKLAQLLYQQVRHTFTSVDQRSSFIRRHDLSADPKVPSASVQEADGLMVQDSFVKQDCDYFLQLGEGYSDNEEPEKAVAAYKGAAALRPEDIELLRGLAERIRALEVYPEAEAIYRQILEVNSRDYLAYVELGMLSNVQGKPDEAQALFAEARKLQPALTRELHRIGRNYRDRGNDRMMEKYCLMAVAADPDNDSAYAELGLLYVWLNRRGPAREMLQRAIELNPRNAEAYAQLGIISEREARVDEAKEMYLKALEINPGVWDAVYNLIMIYQREGKLEEAEALYKRMTGIAPGNYRTWGALAAFYSSQGKEDLAREYYEKDNELRFKSLIPATVANYRTLRDILREKGIPLAAMQYPMRSLKELRDIFDDDDGIIFIANEDAFKNAVRRDGYQEYFFDHFAGDFGHCTPRGNRLLAENIADSLASLNVFFHQSRERKDYEFD